MPKPRAKASVVRRKLRRLFIKRDRLEAELSKVIGSITTEVRTLSSLDGLVTPMRWQQAYREVFRDDD